jgi:DNA-binding transcriptional LysR family regulator
VQVAVLTSQQALSRLQEGTLDIALVALPQAAVKGVQIVPWRRDPVLAFLPRAWPRPRTITPAWLAARPLIFNDASTRLHRMTMDWFAAAGERPQARIELNFNDAIKSLVAAGYGAALLPREEGAAALDPRVVAAPLTPRLWRPLGLAHRAGTAEPATRHMLGALTAIRQERTQRDGLKLRVVRAVATADIAGMAGMVKAPARGDPRRLEEFSPASLLTRSRRDKP